MKAFMTEKLKKYMEKYNAAEKKRNTKLGFKEKVDFVCRYPEMIEAIYDVLISGSTKYGLDQWLYPEGKTMSRKINFDSKNHHAARHFSGETNDKDSGLYHLAHEGTRALMELTRLKRKIIHPEDIPIGQAIPVTGDGCISLEENLKRHKNSPYSRPEDLEDNHQL